MNLSEKLSEGTFVRIAEVFPPSYDVDPEKEPIFGLEQKMNDFVKRVSRIQGLADAFLIADLKMEDRVKLSTIHAAARLREELGVEAIPVITARDLNKVACRSHILTALSENIRSIMVVWGDRYAGNHAFKNVYDYGSLAELIVDAKMLASRVYDKSVVLAPINLDSFSGSKGRSLASHRLKAGADSLLAQPPTADEETLGAHLRLLKSTGFIKNVMLNVFPFRDSQDIKFCRERFGWKISTRLERLAMKGEAELLREARKVASRIEDSGVSGLYVSTRGKPELLRYILD
ncbi:MAG: methylenetetrahydrofolate reductase [Nitrososphaerota archaeon]|jgi:5,10-methylenetetrahydrofolate reductase|nr:methylenetetrahydrofolate reductase [Nitrososphaerota archaeon]